LHETKKPIERQLLRDITRHIPDYYALESKGTFLILPQPENAANI
jgi:hypothetical protein